MRLFGAFPPSGVPKGEHSEAESSPSAPLRVKTTFMPSGDEALHFGLLCGPKLEMTKAQIIITIDIRTVIVQSSRLKIGWINVLGA